MQDYQMKLKHDSQIIYSIQLRIGPVITVLLKNILNYYILQSTARYLLTACTSSPASILLKMNALIGCSREWADAKQFHAIETDMAAFSPHCLPVRAK